MMTDPQPDTSANTAAEQEDAQPANDMRAAALDFRKWKEGPGLLDHHQACDYRHRNPPVSSDCDCGAYRKWREEAFDAAERLADAVLTIGNKPEQIEKSLVAALRDTDSALSYTTPNIKPIPHWCPFENGHHDRTCAAILEIRSRNRQLLETALDSDIPPTLPRSR